MDSHQVQDFGDYQAYLFVLANNKVSRSYVDQDSTDFEACITSLEDYEVIVRKVQVS